MKKPTLSSFNGKSQDHYKWIPMLFSTHFKFNFAIIQLPCSYKIIIVFNGSPSILNGGKAIFPVLASQSDFTLGEGGGQDKFCGFFAKC